MKKFHADKFTEANKPGHSYQFWFGLDSIIHPAIAPFLCMAAFAIQIFVPLGISTGVAYFPMVFCAIWYRNLYVAFLFAFIASLLNIWTFFLSPDLVGSLDVAITNRFISTSSLWLLALLVYFVKRREVEALSTEQKFNAILDNTVDGLITIDERGIVQSYNKACEKMFGYEVFEVIGRNIKMLMPSSYAENHDQYLQNYRESGHRKIIGIGREVEAQRKDGTVFPIDLSVAEVKIGQQRLFSGIIRDLTERRLQDEQLRHGQKMEAVGQLTSGVAHDFNNLLTVVLGNTRLIRKVMAAQKKLAVFADISERLDDIDVAARRGADLVRRLMVFTRQRPLQKAEVDINASILEAQGLLMRALGETVHLKMDLQNNMGLVQIDQDQFVNALINIVVNARDAMPQGGTLSIQTKSIQLEKKHLNQYPGLSAGPHVLISISDTGTGMSEDVRSRIFEPFYTTKPAGEGTGLGLSMVYGFIQQSGGHIDVESKLGKGTTFKIYLPQLNQTSV